MTQPRGVSASHTAAAQLGRIHNSFFALKPQFDGSSDHSLQLNQELKREGNKPLNKHTAGTSKTYAGHLVKHSRADLPISHKYIMGKDRGNWKQPNMPPRTHLVSEGEEQLRKTKDSELNCKVGLFLFTVAFIIAMC